MKKNKEDVLKKVEEQLVELNNLSDDSLFNNLDISTLGDNSNRSERLERFGNNEKNVKKFNWIKEFFSSFLEPFNILLLVVGTVELFLYIFLGRDPLELVSSLIVYAMVILAAITDFIQEYLSFKNTTKLLKLIENDVYLITSKIPKEDEINGAWINSNIKQIKDVDLTKGDVIFLNAGDIVPADLKIIWSKNLYVDQSSLTGESDPVEKSKVKSQSDNIFEQRNILISETTIISGECVGVVLNIGSSTYANKILEIASEKNDETDYEIGLAKVTKLILFSILGFFPILLVISGLRTTDWVEATIFAISMVVSLTPESLPAIISSNIQVGSKRMAENDIVVKNFKCVQNLGSTTIITTDKTGTLTTGELKVIDYINFNGKTDPKIMEYAYLNSHYQTNLSNQIDKAIIGQKISLNKKYKLIEKKDFDFKTRVASVLLENDNKYLQITKGAPQEIVKCITKVIINGKVVKATKLHISKIEELVIEIEKSGRKPLLIAIDNDKKINSKELIYAGTLILENEVKEGVKEVIDIFRKYNLDLKVLTGDSPIVSERIGEKIGLDNIKTISASSFENKSVDEQKEIVEAYGIFAKLNPIQKSQIIGSLQEEKEVVTYLGDGINDVPALKTADVGISVNNGSSIAKATSDVILLKKDLRTLEDAIIDGRKIFTNAIKFIKIIVTMNFGLLVTLLISSIWLDFNAMSPIQLLIQNLIYDFMNLAFVFDNVDENYIRKPKKWDAKSILLFALWNGIAPILISIINFLVVGYGFGLFNDINNATTDSKDQLIMQFQSTFFLESLLTHIVLIVIYRTNEFAIFKSRPSYTLVIFLIFFLSLGFIFEYVPVLNTTFGFKPISNNYWLFTLLGYILLAWIFGEVSKWSYVKVFDKWI